MLKIYACYSESHAPFLYRHFLPSVPAGLRVVLHKMPQDCPGGAFRSEKWGEMAKRKFEMCIDACSDPEAGLVFVSDVDARFYALSALQFEQDLIYCLGDRDIAFQWDGEGKFCSGSWVAKPSADLVLMFKRAIVLLPQFKGYDQPAMNAALAEYVEAGRVKHARLPLRYWSQGAHTNKHWHPGDVLQVPANIMVHQGNWCVGADNKMALLNEVKSVVEGQRAAGDAAKWADTIVNETAVSKPATVQVPYFAPEPYSDVQIIDVKKPRLVRSPMMEARERAGNHEVGAPALVMQIWEGDKKEGAELAELIAAVEPEPRKDALFVFAIQEGTIIDARLKQAMLAVGYKFRYTIISTEVDNRKEYPGIAYDPWASAFDQLASMHARGDLPNSSAFFFEPDGCPTSADWIDRLTKEHNATLAAERWFTGPIMNGDYFDRHMNGTMMGYLPAWFNIPSLHTCPPDQAWDIWHGRTICANGRDTRRILNEHNISLTEPLFRQLGREAAWLASVKDGTAQLWARRLLVK